MDDGHGVSGEMGAGCGNVCEAVDAGDELDPVSWLKPLLAQDL